MENIPKEDMFMILRDFNAKIGKEESLRHKITMFEHRQIHKQTFG